MTENDALSFLRQLLGDPVPGSVSNRQLTPWLADALDRLARELKYSLTEDQHSLTLEADEQEYPLPTDVQQLMWIRYAGIKLKPSTTYEWDRDGLNWKEAVAGIPSEYAYEGRKVIFDCPLSAGAISSYPRATVKYVSTSHGITLANMPGLPDADARLACRLAALQFCYARPTAENAARAQALGAVIGMDMEEAQRRHAQPVEDLQPKLGVATSRRGAAR